MDENEVVRWIALTQEKGVGPVKQHELLANSGSVNDILLSDKSLEKAKAILDVCQKREYKILTLKEGLPGIFKHEKDLPIVLYKRGMDLGLVDGIGIVGARRCTTDAKQKAIDISTNYAIRGKVIISGMAKGVDSYSHTAAIKAGGYTVAVLGSGLNYCYPVEHRALMEQISINGMIISEYEPEMAPRTYFFPRRNRIIAALSEKLYVVGTGSKNSGTQSTIDAALKYEKPVYKII